MSALESLITPTNAAHANANPEAVALLHYAFTGTRSLAHGTVLPPRVTLPTEECVTPAVMVAASVLATWQDTEGQDTDLATRAHVAALYARRMVKAACERDRSSQDGLMNARSFDPTDGESVRVIEKVASVEETPNTFDAIQRVADGASKGSHYAVTMGAAISHGASAGNPDAFLLPTQADVHADAFDYALGNGGHADILDAILTPSFGETRARRGASPILRAAGRAVSGRARATNLRDLKLTRLALSRGIFFSRIVNGPIHGTRHGWTPVTRELAASQVSHGKGGASQHTVAEESPVTVTQLVWCAPMTVTDEQNGPVGTARGRMAGIKLPSRRAKRGNTGPTIPENLRNATEAFPQLPTQAERVANLRDLTASLTK
jgi:hypothetical protein